MLFVVMEMIDKILEQMDVKHSLVVLWDIFVRTVVVVVQDSTAMVELAVVAATGAVERVVDDDGDDKVDFERIVDDGNYYCQQPTVDQLA